MSIYFGITCVGLGDLCQLDISSSTSVSRASLGFVGSELLVRPLELTYFVSAMSFSMFTLFVGLIPARFCIISFLMFSCSCVMDITRVCRDFTIVSLRWKKIIF